MSYQIVERQEAVHNALEAFHHYEAKSEGLGAKFLDALDDFYNTLERNPEAYSYFEKPYRQGKIKGYPYVVVFEVQQNLVIIFKIFNTNLEPGKKLP